MNKFTEGMERIQSFIGGLQKTQLTTPGTHQVQHLLPISTITQMLEWLKHFTRLGEKTISTSIHSMANVAQIQQPYSNLSLSSYLISLKPQMSRETRQSFMVWTYAVTVAVTVGFKLKLHLHFFLQLSLSSMIPYNFMMGQQRIIFNCNEPLLNHSSKRTMDKGHIWTRGPRVFIIMSV